ncbi:hypothetical protein LX64_04171 [Chitinophaga skermanii]|uniref:Uncharacterized protein n=1 Tax=Chitinophaga skermanii TaxID=331697 RepID=A0A327Q950_9BACT|nr:hypothetical protein [Chitinophaga skermanii]RAJ00465.1 hypothetical protein LX64_04171 [Chitinophaga skermanii]
MSSKKLFHTALKIIQKNFGTVATWHKENNTSALATVLFKSPSKTHEIGEIDYNIESYTMEYNEDDFPSMMDLVMKGELQEVTIEGTRFYVRSCTRKFDGSTIYATLNLITT